MDRRARIQFNFMLAVEEVVVVHRLAKFGRTETGWSLLQFRQAARYST
jgi:hypothetical protein